MKLSAFSSLSVLSLLTGTLTLVGCGGAFSMPDSVASVDGGTPPIVGSVFGGHAPIVGSHVYLLQPSVSGYGTVATSILGTGTTTTPGGYALQTNPASGGDPNIPSGWRYVVTDSAGGFNLSGAYTCAAGQPVYIYSAGGNATGGSPLTANNPGIVQLAVLGNCPTTGNLNFGSGSSDFLNYVYVNEVSTVAAAYVFQPFTTVATTAAKSSAIFVGTSGTTQALLGIENAASTAAQLYAIQGNATLSTATGEGEGHVANYRTQQFSVSGSTVRIAPNAGNGLVPQATIDTLANILADCIDSNDTATTTSTQCNTLFTNTTESGTTNGTPIKPTDTARAAINLARYPGGNNSTGTPTSITALYALGNGTVPYLPRLSTAPNDFTIAINYPYTAVTGISTSNPDVFRAESVQVDSQGQLWITAQGGGNGGTPQPSADRWSPLGSPNAFNNQSYIYGYVSIDSSDNAWTGNANSSSGIFEAGSNGAFTAYYGANFNSAYTLIADGSSTPNIYFWASDTSNDANSTCITHNGTKTCDSEMFKLTSGALASSSVRCNNQNGAYTFYCITAANGNTIFTTGDNVAHGAIDASGDFWLTSESANQPNFFSSTYQIARVSPTGAALQVFDTDNQQPESVSIDASANVWIPNQATTGAVYELQNNGNGNILTSNGANYPYNGGFVGTTATGALMTSTFGSAVDGNGNVWFTNRCGNYGVCGTTAGNNTVFVLNGATDQAISPATNYVPETQYYSTTVTAPSYTKMLNDSLNLAIDPSGNVWITNYLGNAMVELVGAAAPVVTPLSVAASTNKLGTKP